MAIKEMMYSDARKIITIGTPEASKILPMITDENPPIARPTLRMTLLAVERMWCG